MTTIKPNASQKLPLVFRWDTFPMDLSHPPGRFKVSRFNYLVRDREAKVIMGFWEAEAGEEIVGETVGLDTADELMILLDGRLYVSAPGEEDCLAKPGDVIAAMHYRRARIVAKERALSFFVSFNIDVGALERIHNLE